MPESYKVPQNVDLEDKILGPFTLKQFLMLLGMGFAIFMWYNMFRSVMGVFFVLTFFTVIITCAFIFVRPNDQSFSKFFFSFMWFSLKPNRRIWHRVPSLGDMPLSDTEEKPVETVDEPSAEEVRSRLQRLSHIVDTRGWGGEEGDEPDIAARVTSGEAKPKLNLNETDSDQPEDILAAEDEKRGSDRVTSELERVLRQTTAKAPTNREPTSA